MVNDVTAPNEICCGIDSTTSGYIVGHQGCVPKWRHTKPMMININLMLIVNNT